ncbi:MAG TPA: GAF domain-containing sensor histidine kinase [Candidatus Hydrogenedentes bacterium]|nr:GAF domain-containing sensor histidine kinase [Candidatus Hydrogenedentota bacterium]
MTEPEMRTLPWLAHASPADINRAVEALYHVHGLMTALTDLDTLLERISEEGRAVARAEAASVMLYDDTTNELYFRVALGDSGDQETLKREVRLKPGQGIAGAAAQDRVTVHVPNVNEDPRFYSEADEMTRFQTRNLLAVPMIERNQLVGVLELVNKIDGDSFSPLDQYVMEMFGSVAASAVVNARLIEEQIRTTRLAAIGQAIAGLTHHIKNILTGLTSSAELIEMGLETGNNELVKKTWPVLRRSTHRISNFVQDLLLYAKPRKPVVQRCETQRIIVDACETMRDLFDRKNIAAEVQVAKGVDPIYADPDALYRCLMNLVTNAADAVPETGGRIVIAAHRAPDNALEITVSDNGPGIPPEMGDSIFEIFFSTKGSHGTGLGLACARKIAQEHGGDLTLLEPSEGACFKLSLPVDEEKQ